MKHNLILIALLLASPAWLCTAAAASGREVLVEAESFAQPGGWVVDQQVMDQMGSAFMLAHGLGVPVKDATTTVEFPQTGAYRLWVRTRDWVAPWKTPETHPDMKAKGTPGIFQVLVDGKAVPVTFGTEGAEWHWQDGGVVAVAQKTVTLALKAGTDIAQVDLAQLQTTLRNDGAYLIDVPA